MTTFSIRDMGIFIEDLFNEIGEETLWEFYLHKVQSDVSFSEFKEQQLSNNYKIDKVLTKEKEKEQLEWSEQFVKPRIKVGGM